MLKKLISTSTASLLLATGLSFVSAPSAFAGANDASLDLITIKDVNVTNFGTPNATLASATPGSVTLTTAQATGTGMVMFRPTYTSGTPGARIQKFSSGAALTFTSTDQFFSGSLANGDRLVAKQTSQDNTTTLYYVITITVGTPAPADVTLATTSKIRGVTISSLGTPNSDPASVVRGAITLTSDQAASLSSSTGFETQFNPTSNLSQVATAFKRSSSDQVWTIACCRDNRPSDWNGLTAITTGDYLQVAVEEIASRSNYKWYIFDITVTGGGTTPAVDLVAQAAAQAAAAAAKREAAVRAAKENLVDSLKAGKPITASDLSSADIDVASSKVAERVIAKVGSLPLDKRTDLAAVQAIVRTENLVDKVSTALTQKRVRGDELVQENLVPAGYKYTTSVLLELRKADPSTLDSIEKIGVVVKAAMAKIQARKDRFVAVRLKLDGRATK
jgi:hypothetical protein